jgi:hypothetical protein
VTPQSDRLFSLPRPGVFRALWLANLVSATGTVVSGCASLGTSHVNSRQLEEDMMPTDRPARRGPKKITRGHARAISRKVS